MGRKKAPVCLYACIVVICSYVAPSAGLCPGKKVRCVIRGPERAQGGQRRSGTTIRDRFNWAADGKMITLAAMGSWGTCDLLRENSLQSRGSGKATRMTMS